MNELEILIAARALIDTPERWTKDALARIADGSETVFPASEGVACRCSLGAIYGASALCSARDRAEQALDDAAQEDGYVCIVSLNDAASTTHADVLAMFDRAIAATRCSGLDQLVAEAQAMGDYE